MRITVLGAGYMGCAMGRAFARGGHEVTVWGTWLDEAILEACGRDEPHPRLGVRLEGLAFRGPERLEDALAGAGLVLHAVSSEGALAVMTRASAFLPDAPIVSVTKGLLPSSRTGRMERLSVALSDALGRPLRWVHVAGPAKARELARDVLTWVELAGAPADVGPSAAALGRAGLVVTTTDDGAGAEITSALKNAYATGLGLWDGYVGPEAHNARAACFTQAIAEIRALVAAGGGRPETVDGIAGVGDLHVTAAAGRNRAFGERVGKGRPAREVADEMRASGELTEGYAAIDAAWRFARERGVARLPFLESIHAVVWQGAGVPESLGRLGEALSVLAADERARLAPRGGP